MPESQGGKTKFFPVDKDQFAEGGDAWECLNAGMEIVQDESGWIIDVWDPKLNISYTGCADAAFDVDSTPRDHTFVMPPVRKDPEDMTEDELTEAVKRKQFDYSAENRAIRVQQIALIGKRKRIQELITEQVKRETLERTGSAYLFRRVRVVYTGGGSGFRGASSRTYVRRYRNPLQGVRIIRT